MSGKTIDKEFVVSTAMESINTSHCFQHKYHVMLSNPAHGNQTGSKTSTSLYTSCTRDSHSQLLWHWVKDSRWESLSCHTSTHRREHKGPCTDQIEPWDGIKETVGRCGEWVTVVTLGGRVAGRRGGFYLSGHEWNRWNPRPQSPALICLRSHTHTHTRTEASPLHLLLGLGTSGGPPPSLPSHPLLPASMSVTSPLFIPSH